MDSLRRIFENIKDSLASLFSGGRHGRGRDGYAPYEPAPPDSPAAARRRSFYASRVRGEAGPDETENPDDTANAAGEANPADDGIKPAGDEPKPAGGFQGYGIDRRSRAGRPFYTSGNARTHEPGDAGGEVFRAESPAEKERQGAREPYDAEYWSGTDEPSDENQRYETEEPDDAEDRRETREPDDDQPGRPINTGMAGLFARFGRQGGEQSSPRSAPGQTYSVDRVGRRWAQRARAAGPGVPVEGPEDENNGKKGRFFAPRSKPPNALLGVAFTTMQLLVFALLLLGMGGVGAVVGIAKAYVDTTPVLDTAKIQDQDLTSFIYDGNGKLVTTFAGIENREWANIGEIPMNLQHAIVAIEDSRFYTHNGVDLKRIVGSFLSNMSSNNTQGGSTITQQLVKNTMVTSERTYKRKIQEAWLAMQLETQYKKPQILEAYLNTIPLGESDYGVKTAAQDYFGKTLDKLTLRECAMLAGLTQSPYLYDPRLNTYTRNRMDLTDKRTNTVLLCMYQQGYIDKSQYDAALGEKVAIKQKSAKAQMYDMPYFVEYAINDITVHLLKARNLEDTPENRSKIDSELRTGGYKIYLTVDPDIQKTVEDTLYNWKKFPKMQISRDSSVTVSNGSGFTTVQQPQAAAVVLDYHTGQLKAIVGGRQQPTAKRTLNRAYQAHMPVGSCIKPIAVYGPAVDMGASPATIIENIPAPVTGWKNSKGVDVYPSNYSGDPFTGPTSIRTGLIHSYNVVAAHVLMDIVGLDNSVDYLQKLGVKSPINKDGPGLALGTSGITPVEMSAAFGAFGNKGEYLEPLSFTKVMDSRGGTVLDAEKVRVKTQAFKPSTAWMMLDMMKDVISRGTGTRAKIKNMTVAGKTGTNSDYRGVSFCALTPYYSSDIWVGSDAYKPLYKGATGGVVAAPIWQSYMSKIVTLKKQKNRDIITDSAASLGLEQATVCGVSGKLVTEACAEDATYKPVKDWFLQGTVPTETCDMHYQMKTCKTTGKLATPFCPEDDVEESGVLIVPQDSPIRKMKPADIQKYFPNAILDFPGTDNLDEFTYDNPLYAQYFCPIHTQEWADLQPQWNTLVVQANTLVNDVKSKMSSYGVSQEVKDALNAKIKAVQDIIKKNFTDPAVPAQTVCQNLQNAINDLRNYANSVLIEPTPTPTPTLPTEPTTEPTASPPSP